MWSQTLIDVAVLVALVLLFTVFLILESRALRTWHGVLRLVAMAPAMVIGWIILGIALNPPAHALWPIELILWLIPAILTLLVARVLFRAAERMHTI